MATDTATPPDEDQDAIQQHYDGALNPLESAEQQAGSGAAGDVGDDEAGFFRNENDGSESGDKGSKKSNDRGDEKDSKDGKEQGKKLDPTDPVAMAEGLYNPGGAVAKRFLGISWSRRKKTVTGGVLGLILGGGILIGMGISTGPLQTIHLGEILGHSFDKNQSDSANRTGKLFRYARAAKNGNIGETRVGILGKKVFYDTIQQLDDIGINIETGRTGQPTRTTIDTEKLKNSFPQLDGMSDANQKALIADKLGISPDAVTGKGGKFAIDQGDMNIKTSRFLTRSTVGLLDDGQIVSAVKARTLTKVLDLPSLFHFFSRSKAALTQKYVNGKPVNEEKKAAQDLADEEKAITTTASGDGAQPELNDAKGKLTDPKANLVRGLTFTGFACQARSITSDVVRIDRARVVLPAIAMASSVIAAGSQVKSGNDMDAAGLGALTATFTDKAGRTIWQSKPLQALAGNPTKNLLDISNAQRQGFSSHNTINAINKLSSDATGGQPEIVCSKIGLTIQALGAITIAGIEEIGSAETGGTAGIAAIAGEFAAKQAFQFAAMAGVTKIIDDIILSKTTLDGLSADAFKGLSGGGMYAYGSRAAANQAGIVNGGVEVSNSDTTTVDNRAAVLDRQQFQSESLFARMFDARDYRSLTGRLADTVSPSMSSNLFSFADGLNGLFGSIPHAFASLLPGVSAATTTGTYDWGFPQVGIPQSMLDDPSLSDPYANADDVAHYLDANCRQADAISGCTGSGESDYIGRVKTCFGLDVTLTQDPDSQKFVWDTALSQGTDIDTQSDTYMSAHCNDQGDPNWRRVVMWVNDNGNMKAAACYEGDDQSCQDLGAEAGSQTQSTGAGSNFRVATYNMHVHTSSAQNQVAVNNMKDNGFQIVGMQELSYKDTFDGVKTKLSNIGYDIYPQSYSGTWDMNSTAITWDTNKFTLARTDSITYPAGDAADCQNAGDPCKRPGIATTSPIVWLTDNKTQQQIIVMNAHTFAFGNNSRFNGDKIRSDAAKAFTAKIQSLQSENLPIVFTGDFNEGYGPLGTAYCDLETQNLMISPFVDKPSDYCKTGGKVWAMGAVDHILTSPGLQGTANELTAQGSRGPDGVYANLGTDHKQVPYSDVVVPSSSGATSTTGSPSGSIVPSACYTVTNQNLYKTEGKMLHWSSGIAINSYPKEDSPAGIKYAATHGYTSIDLDIHITNDGIPVVTHWAKPLIANYGMPQPFYDPQGKISQNTTIEQMTFAEVSRLRSRDGQSQILSLDQMIQIAAQDKVNLSIEFKTNALIKALPEITGALNTYKVKAYIKADAARFEDSLVAARTYGFWTRGTLGSEGAKPPDACHVGGA